VGLSFILSTDGTSGSSITKLEAYCSDDSEAQNIRDSDHKNTKMFDQFCELGSALVGITIKADSIITFQTGIKCEFYFVMVFI
jgi:hypothetical protein